MLKEELIQIAIKIKTYINILDKTKDEKTIELLEDVCKILHDAQKRQSKSGPNKKVAHKIIELRNSGKTLESIARELNISLSTVNRHVKEYRIQQNEPK